MRSSRRIAALVVGATLVLAPSGAQGQGNGEQRTPADGVYTEAQAERGEQTFAEVCSACHGKGQFDRNFLRGWTGAPAYYLYDLIAATMPQDNPGRLEPAQYADVIAYILKLNGFPAGETELVPVEESLMGIRLSPPKDEDGR